MSAIYLRQLLLGPMENFVYLVGCTETKECFVVDPAWDIKAIEQTAQADGMTIKGALVTHYHPDHCGGHLWGHDIAGVAELAGDYNIPVYANKHELEGLQLVTGLSKSDFKSCDSGDKVKIGNHEITLIHTPGHTPGSQCFLIDQNLVSGDTLFISGCGRVDLPGGNMEDLYHSLNTKLAKLPKDTVLYPGHNYDTIPHATLSEVHDRNPYLQMRTLAEWKHAFGMS